ncbi:MAG: GlxA family transcriptional regulator [Dongiaceae bacterium]
MSDTTSKSDTQTIGFLLLPRFSMMAFVSAVEPLRVANRLGERSLYRWEILAMAGKTVDASNGMSLLADGTVPAKSRYAALVVCAGFEPERHYSRKLADWLHRLDRLGVRIGAMDTGSFLVARAGLLNGYRATTHWESLDGFRERFPKVEVESGVYVIDRNRFTCAGGTAALDMMLHFITVQHGHRLAAAVSEQFIHARIRDPQDRQRMELSARQGISNASLTQAIAIMEGNLEEIVTSRAICIAAGVSQRQLERMFRRHLGMTPWQYYLQLRWQRARALLQYSDLPVVEIAIACGFGSAAHFSRSYKGWAGHAPSAERTRQEAGITPSLR